ncbi:MAG: hypothetical protein ACKVT0_06710, partial [Planctomycetaceae bacterium]
MRKIIPVAIVLITVTCWSNIGESAHKWLLKDGNPELKSAGHLAFGPDGILFIGDAKGAAVFAVDTLDAKVSEASPELQIDNLNARLSELLNGSPEIVVNDLAVNPLSKNVYLSVSHTAEKLPALVRIDHAGNTEVVSLENVPYLRATLPNPPEDKVTGEGRRARNNRNDAITDLAFVDGKVLLTGLTSDNSPSTVRSIAFPFADTTAGTNIEIYHGAHGKLEDYAAVRTFVPFTIDGEPSLLAGFTCTPLVRFPLGSLEEGTKVRGTTVAELGNRNVPLDMIVYQKNDETYLLLANSARGVMKISTKD